MRCCLLKGAHAFNKNTERAATVWLRAVSPFRIEKGLDLSFATWPAMRVISLGIRTVPVLSVAKKLAAPRPTPTAPAAKCGLIRQDEAD